MSSASTGLNCNLVLVPLGDVSAAFSALSSTAFAGEWEWVDSDDDNLPDAGETADYTIVVTNEGTVTLTDVNAVSTRGSVVCTDGDGDLAQPVATLSAGHSYTCTTSLEVRVFFPGLAGTTE